MWRPGCTSATTGVLLKYAVTWQAGRSGPSQSPDYVEHRSVSLLWVKETPTPSLVRGTWLVAHSRPVFGLSGAVCERSLILCLGIRTLSADRTQSLRDLLLLYPRKPELSAVPGDAPLPPSQSGEARAL